MSSTSTPPAPPAAKPQPKNPCIQINGKSAYQLYFRRGSRPPETIVFLSALDHLNATNESRDWCDRMGHRFCGCFPFIVDLKIMEENKKLYEHPETVA